MTSQQQYETVIGLEVHARLLTKTKLFSSDRNEFGASPNAQAGPVTLAHPGTLPMLNRQAVAFAVKLGLACGSSITRENFFSRKNYFYPDLPKGFQVTQQETPVCMGGTIRIETAQGAKDVRLHHIHLEEDAGKSLHDAESPFSRIDFNRAGSPLVEIVTEPDLGSPEEAFAFLTEIRKRVRHLGICDGNMEEGSLRCDANISVRKKGETALGTRVEIKNINSMRFLRTAIQFEARRLMDLLDNGMEVKQETRHFDDTTGTTFPSREKEDAEDYRYFQEPDLCPFIIGEDFIEEIRCSLPVPVAEKIDSYHTRWGLPRADAKWLAEDSSLSAIFEKLLEENVSPKSAFNWLSGPVQAWVNENRSSIEEFPLPVTSLAQLIRLVEEGKISFSAASSRLLGLMMAHPGTGAYELALANNLLKQADSALLEAVIDEVLLKFADKTEQYRKGKKGLLGLFVGEVMKRTKGSADPGKVNELILQKLNQP